MPPKHAKKINNDDDDDTDNAPPRESPKPNPRRRQDAPTRNVCEKALATTPRRSARIAARTLSARAARAAARSAKVAAARADEALRYAIREDLSPERVDELMAADADITMAGYNRQFLLFDAITDNPRAIPLFFKHKIRRHALDHTFDFKQTVLLCLHISALGRSNALRYVAQAAALPGIQPRERLYCVWAVMRDAPRYLDEYFDAGGTLAATDCLEVTLLAEAICCASAAPRIGTFIEAGMRTLDMFTPRQLDYFLYVVGRHVNQQMFGHLYTLPEAASITTDDRDIFKGNTRALTRYACVIAEQLPRDLLALLDAGADAREISRTIERTLHRFVRRAPFDILLALKRRGVLPDMCPKSDAFDEFLRKAVFFNRTGEDAIVADILQAGADVLCDGDGCSAAVHSRPDAVPLCTRVGGAVASFLYHAGRAEPYSLLPLNRIAYAVSAGERWIAALPSRDAGVPLAIPSLFDCAARALAIKAEADGE